MLALAVAARLAGFAGAMVLFGAPLFQLYARGSAAASGRMLWGAAWAVLLGALVSLSAQTASMTGEAGDALRLPAIWDVASGTGFGKGVSARLILAAGFAAVLAGVAASPGRTILLTLLGAGVTASFAWTGHGAGEDGAAGLLHQGGDVLHLLAAGAWLGALAVLVAAVLTRSPDLEALHLGLNRFSAVGPAVVGVLILSGLVNSGFLVGLSGVALLAISPYGLLLLAKLALFAVMLGLAWTNRRHLTPKLGAALGGTAAGEVRALRASLVIETLLGLGVLAAVAGLGMLEPVAHG